MNAMPGGISFTSQRFDLDFCWVQNIDLWLKRSEVVYVICFYLGISTNVVEFDAAKCLSWLDYFRKDGENIEL